MSQYRSMARSPICLLEIVQQSGEVRIMGQRAFDICRVAHCFVHLVGSIIVPSFVMVDAFAIVW